MSRFTERLRRADRRVDHYFAETLPVWIYPHGEARVITAIFEDPDAPVGVPGGGEIRDAAPAISAHTAEIQGLCKRDKVIVRGDRYWVVRTGANEAGRTRITLARGEPGAPAPLRDGSRLHE